MGNIKVGRVLKSYSNGGLIRTLMGDEKVTKLKKPLPVGHHVKVNVSSGEFESKTSLYRLDGIKRFLKEVFQLYSYNIVNLCEKFDFDPDDIYEMLSDHSFSRVLSSDLSSYIIYSFRQQYDKLFMNSEELYGNTYSVGYDKALYAYSIGLGDKTPEIIYSGIDLEDIVAENPYRLPFLVDDFNVIEVLDNIAMNQTLDIDINYERSLALIYIYLQMLLKEEGSSYIPREIFIKKVRHDKSIDLRGLPVDILLDHLIKEKNIKIQKQRLYTFRLYDKEVDTAERLKELSIFEETTIDTTDYLEFLKEYEEVSEKKLSNDQSEAFVEALNNKLFIISGLPGTGKSLIIDVLIKYFESKELQVGVCAPTGRASSGLSDKTDHQVETLHRMLKSDGMSYEYGEDNKLDYDVVIIDEFSMVDIFIFKQLLDALKDSSRLILVGDVEQLPSVSYGQVMHDLIKSKKIPTIQISELFRQQEGNGIPLLARDILTESVKSPEEYPNIYFIPSYSDEVLLQNIKNIIGSKHFKLADVQMICPSRSSMDNSMFGTDELNVHISELLFGKIDWKNKFRIDEPVIITRNDYDKNVHNGDLAMMVGYENKGKEIVVSLSDADDRKVSFDKIKVDDFLDYGYVLTVHKSQGQEYNVVILILSRNLRGRLVNKKLIYTAITRAKKKLILLGSFSKLKEASRSKQQNRLTSLGLRVAEIFDD